MDRIKASVKSYWNWRSRSFGHDADKSPCIAERWESILKDLVSGAPGKRVLDVGTGTGQFAAYLARSGYQVTGIDLAENMVKQARRYANHQGLDIDFQTGDAENLTFEDHSFDAVVTRNVLWTLPHPDKALAEWRRVLKPGGVLVVSDGVWYNTTWSRCHQLILKGIKNLWAKRSLLTFRFFFKYAGIQNRLPLYEGLTFENASRLMTEAEFREIESRESQCRDFFPYGNPMGHPAYFIACARR